MKYCSYKALEIGLFSFGAFCIFGTLGKYFGAFISTFLALSFGCSDPDPVKRPIQNTEL